MFAVSNEVQPDESILEEWTPFLHFCSRNKGASSRVIAT